MCTNIFALWILLETSALVPKNKVDRVIGKTQLFFLVVGVKLLILNLGNVLVCAVLFCFTYLNNMENVMEIEKCIEFLDRESSYYSLHIQYTDNFFI